MMLLRSVLDTQTLGVLALLIPLGMMLTQIVRVPGDRRGRQGDILHGYPVPTMYRLRRQRLPLVLLAVVTGVDATLGIVPTWGLAVALVAAVVILVIPVRCEITTDGVRVGWLPVRRWTEFGGLRVRQGTIHLLPISGSSGFAFPLTGRFEDGDLVAEVRGLITRAYKGSSLRVVEPHDTPTTPESVEDGKGSPLAIAR